MSEMESFRDRVAKVVETIRPVVRADEGDILLRGPELLGAVEGTAFSL